MMMPTHVVVGIALALPVALYDPSMAELALWAGAIGGASPDFDMYYGHRSPATQR